MPFSGERDRSLLTKTLRDALDRQSEERLVTMGLEKAWQIPTENTGDEEREFLLGLTPDGKFLCFEREPGDTEWGDRRLLSAKNYEEAMKEVRVVIAQRNR